MFEMIFLKENNATGFLVFSPKPCRFCPADSQARKAFCLQYMKNCKDYTHF